MKIKKTDSLKNFKLFSLSFIICFFALFSCTKENTYKDLGHSYFPYSLNFYTHFVVDSTIWDDFTGEVYTSQSQILEVVESIFTDLNGDSTYRIEQFTRKNDSDEWQIKRVFTANIHNSRAEITIENLRQIKLVFPPQLNTRWNANAFNSLENETWKISEIHKPKLINSINLDSTLTVLQSNEYSLVSEDHRYEVYATNIGLVQQYEKVVSKNFATQEIVKGKLVVKSLKSYGYK